MTFSDVFIHQMAVIVSCVHQTALMILSFMSVLQMEMITQADSVYDIIDPHDLDQLKKILHGAAAGDVNLLDEFTFHCRMNIARSFRRQTGYERHKVRRVT